MAPAQKDLPAAHRARALPFLVALSGAAALVYQSLWMRSFGLIFGGTTSAVAMVLAVFMGGLALGSALAARRPARDPLRAYAHVELAVGAFAVLTLPLLRALPWAYGALVARAGLTGIVESLGLAVLAALVLLPPTVLLGATVPLAVEYLTRAGADVHAGFSRLYLVNTLGGALGVALTPFVLVPALGVRGTLVAAAALSLFVGGLALRWARETAPLPATPATTGADTPPPALGLALALLSGTATFGVEVLWTRSYALVIGSSIYAFNLMLLAVLLGIAGGSALYARLRPRLRKPVRASGVLFAVAGLAVLAGQWAIGRLPMAYLAALDALPVSFAAHQLAGFLLCLTTMLPVTIVLGLSFPLLLHLVDPRKEGAQQASGRLYAWNTAGAITGALAADLVLVPRLGLQPAYLAFAGLLLVGATWALGTAASWRPAVRAAAVLAVAVAIALLVPRWRPWDPVLMTSGVYRYGLEWVSRVASPLQLPSWLREQRTLLFYREGAEAVVGVSEPVGGRRRFLSVNGKTDAGSGAEDVVTQKFIAHVPMLLHAAPRRVLVIGWGAGATAASMALHPVEDVECIEIEPATWEAAPFFADLNTRLLRDPRFRIAFRDGRNHLLRSRAGLDVIVSEPSNPWISGVSNLFTRELHEAALARLAPGGLFGQWFHYYNLDRSDVQVEVKTFLSVFPHASLWLVPPVGPSGGTKNLGADLLLVGSREPQRLSYARLEKAFADPTLGPDLRATQVIGDPASFVATWVMGRAEMERWVENRDVFPRGTPLNTDDHPYVELMAPRRNVMRPEDAAAAAAAQYTAMGALGGDVRPHLSDAPAPGPLLRGLAQRYMEAVQPERAARALDAAVLADPRDPRSWELLGEVALDRRDYPRAEEAHRALLRAEPGNVGAWLRLGAILARQKRWGEARDAIARAQALDAQAPVDPELVAFLARQ
jgi:spermidine synthase